MEEIKKRYPFLLNEDRLMPDSLPATVLSGPCGLFLPLQMKKCNGDCASSFQEAAVYVKGTISPTEDEEISCVRMCIADAQIFMGMTFDLLFRPNKNAESRRMKALQTLENFLSDKGHLSCLTQLSQDKELTGITVQEVLAVHLFMPLSMEISSTETDGGRYNRNSGTKCKFCSTKVPTANILFGNHQVWHGRADILLDHSIVKIVTQNEDDYDDTLDYSIAEYEAGEPVLKKRKTKDVRVDGVDSDVSEDEVVENTSHAEVKLGKVDHYMPEGPARFRLEIQLSARIIKYCHMF